MANVPNGVKILPQISIASVGRTNVTDRRQTDRHTDGRPMTYSEHELEFTFAKKRMHWWTHCWRPEAVFPSPTQPSCRSGLHVCMALLPVACTPTGWLHAIGEQEWEQDQILSVHQQNEDRLTTRRPEPNSVRHNSIKIMSVKAHQ